MRRDYLIVRHPKPKPQDDWFMLDRWTPATAHTVTSKYREVKAGGVTVELVFRSVCTCGWRSLEYHEPTTDRCPVEEALVERAKRQERGERTTWLDVKEGTTPGVMTPSTG